MVFAGLYPVESHEHGLLRDALEKLRLNDSAFNFEPENSVALGFRVPLRLSWPAASGDRPGAAGARIQIDLITTAPGVRYRVTTRR